MDAYDIEEAYNNAMNKIFDLKGLKSTYDEFNDALADVANFSEGNGDIQELKNILYTKRQNLLSKFGEDTDYIKKFLDYRTKKMDVQAGGGYTTVLGRRRKVVMKGRTKCVTIKGELVPVSKAKAMEKKK